MKQLVFVAVLMLLTSALGQSSGSEAEPFTDPEGDVQYILLEQQTVAAVDDHGPADITGLSLTETHNDLVFHVSVANLDEFPEGSDAWVDAASLDVRFWIGELYYNVRTGISQTGFAYGEVRGGQTDMREPTVARGLDVDVEGSTFTVVVPREHLRDESGAPVQKGMVLSDLHVDSHVHSTGLFFPDPQTNEMMQVVGIRDRMPDEGSVEISIALGGPQSSGPVRLSSPAPFRASNGGEGTFKFDLQAFQVGEDERTYALEFEDVPEAWHVEFPAGNLRLPPGVPADFSILVHTPFGHQHGGAESFRFLIRDTADANQWASVELGLYYVAVPQPSGHHPTMWFHSAVFPGPFTPINNALGGQNGELWMNTIEGAGENGDVDDEEAPIQGWTSLTTNDRFNFAICMQPELLMGIDMDVDGIGTIELPLSSGRNYQDVEIEGTLKHLGPGEDFGGCFRTQYADRPATVLAEFRTDEPVDLSPSTTLVSLDVLPTAASDYIPFKAGSLLVLEFVADPADILPANPTNPSEGTAVGGPNALSLMPGGSITLPLNEYHDARPGGLIGLNAGDEEEVDDNATLDSAEFAPTVDEQEAPAVPIVALLAALFVAAVARRRE